MEKPDIRLEKLVLCNYKGFYTGNGEGVEITFDPNLTVFIGDNGSGKSAVLDAIALFLVKLRQEISSIGEISSIYPFPPPSIEKRNKSVNNHKEVESAELDAFFKLSPTPIWEDEIERSPRVGLSIEMVKAKSPSAMNISKWYDHSKIGIEELDHSTNDYKTLDLFLRDQIHDPFMIGEFKNKEKDKSIPILVYYGANTINASIEGELEEVDTSIFDAYQDALDANKFSFKQFFAWYDGEKKKLMQKITNGTAERTDPPNEHISEAIKQILNDADRSYSKLDIDWLEYPHDMTLVKKNGSVHQDMELSISQLSSGERTLVALVADLTRRLCLANPNSKKPLEGNGIVLIDEIDVHLHPKWQQKVVTKLRKVFPNIQFILTTHSPLVLTYLPDSNFKVYRLWGGEVEKFDKVRGMRLIEIFYNLYETLARPKDTQEEIDQLFEAINKKLSDNDPAIIEAETSLKYIS